MNNSWKELGRTLLQKGKVYSLFRRTIVMPNGQEIVRDSFEESAAVAIVALNERNEIAILSHYRVAIDRSILEIPAGRLDVPGESPLDAAKRELLEEADVKADFWYTLVDTWKSPGITNGRIRVYLATQLTEQPAFSRVNEEAEMDILWMPIREAQDKVFAGEITDGHSVAGILAAHHFAFGIGLPKKPRPADAPWVLTPVS